MVDVEGGGEVSATPGKITSVSISSDGENWTVLPLANIASVIDDIEPERDCDVVWLRDWMNLLGQVEFHMTFDTNIRQFLKLRAAFKLARRKERNLALAKGKHNLKRPK